MGQPHCAQHVRCRQRWGQLLSPSVSPVRVRLPLRAEAPEIGRWGGLPAGSRGHRSLRWDCRPVAPRETWIVVSLERQGGRQRAFGAQLACHRRAHRTGTRGRTRGNRWL